MLGGCCFAAMIGVRENNAPPRPRSLDDQSQAPLAPLENKLPMAAFAINPSVAQAPPPRGPRHPRKSRQATDQARRGLREHARLAKKASHGVFWHRAGSSVRIRWPEFSADAGFSPAADCALRHGVFAWSLKWVMPSHLTTNDAAEASKAIPLGGGDRRKGLIAGSVDRQGLDLAQEDALPRAQSQAARRRLRLLSHGFSHIASRLQVQVRKALQQALGEIGPPLGDAEG